MAPDRFGGLERLLSPPAKRCQHDKALFGRRATAALAPVAFVARARDQAGAHQVALAFVRGASRGKRGRDKARDRGR